MALLYFAFSTSLPSYFNYHLTYAVLRENDNL